MTDPRLSDEQVRDLVELHANYRAAAKFFHVIAWCGGVMVAVITSGAALLSMWKVLRSAP